MDKLSKLFHECAYDISYQQVGDSVNYAFKEEGSTLYIYFQGSNSVTDWIRNFLFGKRPYKDMKIPYRVHRGFLEAWKEVEDIVIAKVTEKDTKLKLNRKKMKFEDKETFRWKEIIVVGYSHGGALAAFATECVWYWRPDLREGQLRGYGFEAPRIYAGLKVKNELKERWEHFTVIRTNQDIVTHCPPRLFVYTHVGNLLKINGDTSLVKEWYIPKCIKSHYPQVVYNALLEYEKE